MGVHVHPKWPARGREPKAYASRNGLYTVSASEALIELPSGRSSAIWAAPPRGARGMFGGRGCVPSFVAH
eukprot:6201320-Pleurochrysis_carterae.AAC.1